MLGAWNEVAGAMPNSYVDDKNKDMQTKPFRTGL